MMAVMYRIQIL